MPKNHDSLIESLVDDLQPVRPLQPAMGGMLVASAAALTGVIVLAINGLAANIAPGAVSPLFLLANGLLLLLGLAACSSTISMASPRVGNRHDGTRWAMVMAGVFPAVTIALLAVHRADWPHLLDAARGWHCFAEAMLASVLTAAALLFWLRRGAPVSPKMAGLHLGVASTALGTAIYGLSCPNDTMFHLGIWHVLPVVLGGMIGRLVAPALLRW